MNSQAFSEWLTVVLYIGENHGNSADLRKANILHEGTFSTFGGGKRRTRCCRQTEVVGPANS